MSTSFMSQFLWLYTQHRIELTLTVSNFCFQNVCIVSHQHQQSKIPVNSPKSTNGFWLFVVKWLILMNRKLKWRTFTAKIFAITGAQFYFEFVLSQNSTTWTEMSLYGSRCMSTRPAGETSKSIPNRFFLSYGRSEHGKRNEKIKGKKAGAIVITEKYSWEV